MVCVRWLLVACAFGFALEPAIAQDPRTPPRDNVGAPVRTAATATLQGRITRADTGEPLGRAVVSLLLAESRAVPLDDVGNPDPPVLPEAITDDSGRFELTGLPSGSYRLTASRTGYATLSYGQRTAQGAPRSITARAGETIAGLDVALPRGAVLIGQVLDPAGQPAAGTEVQLYRRQTIGGRVQLVDTKVELDLADDRGFFRLYGVPNGSYVVAARYGSQTGAALIGGVNMGQPTYYPGTTVLSEAGTIVVDAPEERSGIAFSLLAPRLAHITVVVTNPDGTLARNVSWSLSRGAGGGATLCCGPADAEGKYRMDRHAPGPYIVEVVDRRNGGFARAEFHLDGTDLEVPLTLTPGHALRGRIVFASGATPKGLTPRSIRGPLHPPDDDRQWPRAQLGVKDDWTFEINGLGGVLRFEPTVQRSDVIVTGIRVGGSDLPDGVLDFNRGDISDVEIVLSERLPEVGGHVSLQSGQPARDATVVIFPEQPGRWGLRRYSVAVRVEPDGSFNHRGLPPGRYLIVAVDYLESGAELDSDTLERLRPGATPVNVVESERREVELALRPF